MPPDLLSRVPAELHSLVTNYYDDWAKACEEAELSATSVVSPGDFGYVLACSDFLANWCIRNPGQWQQLAAADLGKPRSQDDYDQQVTVALSGIADDQSLARVLRKLRQREMCRIAWRDLCEQASTKETLADLSALAQSCITLSLDSLHQRMCAEVGVPVDSLGKDQQLMVLAMGKLGGGELNFSSDVDLILVFPQEGSVRGKHSLSAGEFFLRQARTLVKLLGDITEDGFVYRVDTRLRPFGESGPLVISLDAMEHYYQSQGRDWERYAMIKMRVLCGSRESMEFVYQIMRPFVFRRYLDFGAFASIREMKSMIDAEIKRKGIENNIKLGAGGIREIEFIAQTLQMIRGGHEKNLQTRSTLRGLKFLGKYKHLTEHGCQKLMQGYLFLRHLENRLQILGDQQTHTLPTDELTRSRIALAMNFDSWKKLSDEISVVRTYVHEQFEDLFTGPRASAERQKVSDDKSFHAYWMGRLNHPASVEVLGKQGFTEPEDVYELLESFRKSSGVRALSHTGRVRLRALMPDLLDTISERTSQRVLLLRTLDFLQSILRRSVYLALLVEYPLALHRLVRYFDASPWISALITRHPVLLDELLDERRLHRVVRAEEMDEEIRVELTRCGDDDLELQMEILRHFRQVQVMRIAAMSIYDELEISEVGFQLSLVAESILRSVREIAWREMTRRHGRPVCIVDDHTYYPDIAIVAYGKLGGRELGYASDLDIIFLHDSHGTKQVTDGEQPLENSMFFSRLAQRIVFILSAQTAAGRLYETDTRLRPDGQAGLLVSPLAAFERYQLTKAWTWEHQALVRARVVTAGEHIRDEFDRIRRSVLAQKRDSGRLYADVLEMRHKMRDHLGSKAGVSKTESEFNIKHDAGGLVDIEFIAQAGVLLGACENEELMAPTSTGEILPLLCRINWLDRSQMTQLLQAYADYRELGNQRALKGDDQLGADGAMESTREQVKNIWRQLLQGRITPDE